MYPLAPHPNANKGNWTWRHFQISQQLPPCRNWIRVLLQRHCSYRHIECTCEMLTWHIKVVPSLTVPNSEVTEAWNFKSLLTEVWGSCSSAHEDSSLQGNDAVLIMFWRIPLPTFASGVQKGDIKLVEYWRPISKNSVAWETWHPLLWTPDLWGICTILYHKRLEFSRLHSFLI
jgi:hypothetical protein